MKVALPTYKRWNTNLFLTDKIKNNYKDKKSYYMLVLDL